MTASGSPGQAAPVGTVGEMVEAAAQCPSREAHYVPWSFGEVFECLACKHRERQVHTLQPLRGAGYQAVYPFPPHHHRDLRCMACLGGFHDVCAGISKCDCPHSLASQVAERVAR